MRILTSLLLMLAGLGCVAYSYIGAYVQLLREMEQSETLEDVSSPVLQLFEYLASGGAPQLTSFLYFGLLLFTAGVVRLIVRRREEDAPPGD